MVDSIVRKYRSWVKYRETLAELERLTARELADLGIARGEIDAVARRVAR